MDLTKDHMVEFMEPPPHGTETWFESKVPWTSLGCDGTWKHNVLRLRVVYSKVGSGYYVAPWEVHSFKRKFEQMKIGPYTTLEDAQLAAEMIGEIGREGYEYIESRG